MKKLSKINENLWADLQDRSSGEVTRKEDYITSREELDEIIKSAYEKQGKGDVLTLDFTGMKILVDDMSRLFSSYPSLTQINGLETWDMSKVKNIRSMFYNCGELTKLDLGTWDVSQVEDMGFVFGCCFQLVEVLGLENWNTKNVINLHGMFQYCYELKNIDVASWDVSSVEDMSSMFLYCRKLESIDVSGWNTSHLETKDTVNMFYNCTKLKPIDISKWGEEAKEGILKTCNIETTEVRKEKGLEPIDKYNIRAELLKSFAKKILYYGRYEATLKDYKTFYKDQLKHSSPPVDMDSHLQYIQKNWDQNINLEKRLKDYIDKEKKALQDLGFQFQPGKCVDETINDWWDSLDDDERLHIVGCTSDDPDVNQLENFDIGDWIDIYVNYKEKSEN